MVGIDKNEMLRFFESLDAGEYFYTCADIVNAGDPKYGIASVEFYLPSSDSPKTEYAEFIMNRFKMLIVFTNSRDKEFLVEITAKMRSEFGDYNEVRLSTQDVDLYRNPVILDSFSIAVDNQKVYGIFGCKEKGEIKKIHIPDNVAIRLSSVEDKNMIDNLPNEEWDGLARHTGHMEYSDLLFLLFDDGVLAGYLHANTCYKNMYDIANVFVHKNHRGKNYGAMLAVFYANHCFDNGFIPHYGSAVSEYSEAVARKSGFREVSRTYYYGIKRKGSGSDENHR